MTTENNLTETERCDLTRKFQEASQALNALRNALAPVPKTYRAVNRLDGKLGDLRRELGV